MRYSTDLSRIRPLKRNDLTQLLSLEVAIWDPKGIEAVTEETARRWLDEGVGFGYFDRGELQGYVYGEVINFRPVPPYSTGIVAALRSYQGTRATPGGNALHGLSMATSRPGVGGPLLTLMVREARRRKLRYFVSLVRLEGLGRFVKENRDKLGQLDIDAVAALYAIQAVSWIDPTLIGEPLCFLEMPPAFPLIRRKDPVVSRFARIGKSLWGVAQASFDDPQSLGYSALLVLPL